MKGKYSEFFAIIFVIACTIFNMVITIATWVAVAMGICWAIQHFQILNYLK